MNYLKFLLPFMLLLSSSCNVGKFFDANEKELQQVSDALSVTLEANLKYREVQSSCGFGPFSKKIVSKIALVPINKEVIDATVRLKSLREKMKSQDEQLFLQKNYDTFLTSDRTTFIFIAVNNATLEYGKDKVIIESPNNNIFVTSQGKTHKLIDFTTSLGTNLNPGWNDGYLHFQNFRKNRTGIVKDYSVHINSMRIVCDSSSLATQPWAFSFDDSDTNYLSFIKEGLSKDDVRKRYNLSAFTYLDIKEDDVTNIVKLVLKFMKSN
jgi:hypothetical protein